MRTLLFGGTDLSLAVAERLAPHIAGVVAIPREFTISHQPGGSTNQRFADLLGWAAAHDVPAIEWSGVDSAIELIDRVTPDWGLAAGWYYLLPSRLRDRIPRGVAGLHASLLPAYRGAAPLNWALLEGRSETGISLFQLTDAVDDGPLHGQTRIPIGPRSTIAELVAATEAAALDLVSAAVADPDAVPVPQEGEPTYCLARRPEDSRIDWSGSVEQIDRLVRASGRPYGGAWCDLDGRRVTIWAGAPVAARVSGMPGQIWRRPDGGVAVVTGDGPLGIGEAEVDGADALPVLARASMQRLV